MLDLNHSIFFNQKLTTNNIYVKGVIISLFTLLSLPPTLLWVRICGSSWTFTMEIDYFQQQDTLEIVYFQQEP